MTVLEALACDGWRLRESALEQWEKHTEHNFTKVVDWALNQDLTDIGEKYIQETALGKDGLLVGPCVLQVSRIRNVSAPKENEYSNIAPRMLKISLTDGSSTISAVEYELIDQISLKTPPGTKVKLLGSTAYSSGLLQLQPGCIKVLGGKVEKLYTKWKISCDAGLSRAGISTDGGPPPFVAFGKRVENFNRYKQGKKSLVNIAKENENDESEFDEQRKAAIAEVGNMAGDVTFGTDVRVNFGKRLDAGSTIQTSAKKPISYGTSHCHLDEAQKPAECQKIGMYRELSTDSGQKVHQKTLKEFEEMGFKYDDVVFCLRKANNNFDVTMDLLVNMSDASNPHDGRGRPPVQHGRGRGRGYFRPENEDINAQSSNQATLFDFLESKMSNIFIGNDAKPLHDHRYMRNHVPPSKSNYGDRSHGVNGHRGRRRNDNTREYEPRHAAFREGTRGGTTHRQYGMDRGSKPQNSGKADDQYDGNEAGERIYQTSERNRNDANRHGGNKAGRGRPQPSQSGRYDNQHSDKRVGQIRYQTSQNRGGPVDNMYGDTNAVQKGNKYAIQDLSGHCDEASGIKDGQGLQRPLQGDSDGTSGDRQNDTKANQDQVQLSQQNNRVNSLDRYNDGKHGQGRYQHYQRNRVGGPLDDSRKAGQRQYQPIHGNNSGPPHDRYSTTEQEPQTSKRSKNSLAKKTKGSSNFKAMNTDERFKPTSHKQDMQHNSNRTNDLLSTSDFADVHINPPPQREPTTFGQPPLQPHVRSRANSDSHQTKFHSTNMYHNDPQVHVTVPQWQIGSECLAKYWEDSQYYGAVIADLHPTAPTAVVQFTDFGNYEEVQLFDLKPLGHMNFQSLHSNADSVAQPNIIKEDHVNPRRSVKPPILLYVPPKNRGV